MLLAIDSGNTNTVFAVYDGDERMGVWRCGCNPRRTADEYSVWLIDLMAMRELKREDVNDAIIASVVPDTNFALISLCQRYFDCEAMMVGDPEIDLGVEVLIDRPEQVGADR
ncbi:MAG: type III pantothenate kinase, partial [Alphaproteobacteria bacterium]|nr:type III pantothenate kinase [Alphaproteobacteria bacterium]